MLNLGTVTVLLMLFFFFLCFQFFVLISETHFHDQSEVTYGNVLNVDHFTFPRMNLQIQEKLGHGEFGEVLKATAKEIIPGQKKTTVAVKTLKGVQEA